MPNDGSNPKKTYCSWSSLTEVLLGQRVASKEEVKFCFLIGLRAIDACVSLDYHFFDAHTATNCCHGISARVQQLVSLLFSMSLNLNELKSEGLAKLHALNNFDGDDTLQPLASSWKLPSPLLELAVLYVLAYAGVYDVDKIRKLVPSQLQDIAHVSRKFCVRIVKYLQLRTCNQVAESYSDLGREIIEPIQVSGVPVQSWTRYVETEYLRTDHRGRKYAPCLFSMQVILAHAILRKQKIFFLCDMEIPETGSRALFSRLLQGDGSRGLRVVSREYFSELSLVRQSEPIMVFHGTCSARESLRKVMSSLSFWSHHFDLLVLANDIHYPQFPRVSDDPAFDCMPIMPRESDLRQVIQDAERIKGVSCSDRSLFCLSHIFPASMAQVREILISTPSPSLKCLRPIHPHRPHPISLTA